MSRVKASVSHERELQVLICLHAHSGGHEGAVISIAGVARETALTVYQARCALQRLVRTGLVNVDPRNFPNGAAAENAYRLTQAGLKVLAKTASAPAIPERNTNQ